jgi:4-hydroxy-tetrahydrodipicolinate synthase
MSEGPPRLRGLVTATVMPFTEQGKIDWTSYDRLLAHCATPDFVDAVFVNGHAGEGASLSPRERAEVMAFTRRRIGNHKSLLAGIIAFSTADAIAQAIVARESGADVAVLFPSPVLAAGGMLTPDAPVAFVRAVLDGAKMPVSIFQYPMTSGLGYTAETLTRLAELPGVLAIKEGSDSISAYELNFGAVKRVAPGVMVLASNFDWFLAQMAIGADGILSGLASLIPDRLAELWRATEQKDLSAMREASARIQPIARAIYGAPPRVDMHTRIKAGLVRLGIIDCADPRGPLRPLSASVVKKVTAAIEAAGLGEEE